MKGQDLLTFYHAPCTKYLVRPTSHHTPPTLVVKRRWQRLCGESLAKFGAHHSRRFRSVRDGLGLASSWFRHTHPAPPDASTGPVGNQVPPPWRTESCMT